MNASLEQQFIDQVGDLLYVMFTKAGIPYPAQTATACLHAIADRLDETHTDQEFAAAIRTNLWDEEGLTEAEVPDELDLDHLVEDVPRSI